MRLIEVREGMFINERCIEAIEKLDEFNSKIYTNTAVYDSNIPFVILKMQLEQEPKNEYAETMKSIKAYVETAGTFAG